MHKAIRTQEQTQDTHRQKTTDTEGRNREKERDKAAYGWIGMVLPVGLY